MLINVIAYGKTYNIRKVFKEHGFRWSHSGKHWHKIETEASLNHTLTAITPHYHYGYDRPEINIKLQQVDINGNPLSPFKYRFCLTDMERSVDVLELFTREMSDSCVSPMQTTGPINPKKKQWKELPTVDKGFF